MILNQDLIQRMTGKGGGGTGGGGGFDPAMLAGYATQAWVNENYLSIEFFSKLFKAYNNNTEVVPNDTESTINNIKAMFGFWTNQYLSALGLNSSGGGGGGASTLNDLLDVNISSPTNGQVLMYNSSTGKWYNGTVQSGGTGTVTRVAMTVPTGLSVTPAAITTNGTFAISFSSGYSLPLTADVNKGVTAYSWGNHANAGYATPNSVATQMQNYAHIDNGTIYIGNSSVTPISSVSGTFWGKSWTNGGTLNGSIYAGSNGGAIEGFHSIELNSEGSLSGYGGFIDFHYNGSISDFTSRIIEDISGRLYLNASNGVRIGDAVLKWDSTNNALKVEKNDGTSANFYATGGVSALGVGTGGSVTNISVTGKIFFIDNYKIEVSAGDMYIGDSTSEQYVRVSDMCSWNGSTYWYISASGNARFQRIYLDTSRYLYISSGTLYYFNGSTSKQIAFV